MSLWFGAGKSCAGCEADLSGSHGNKKFCENCLKERKYARKKAYRRTESGRNELRRYRAKHPTPGLKYRKQNQGKIAERDRAYRLANRDKTREWKRENRARKRAMSYGVTIGEVPTLQQLIDKQGGKCPSCRATAGQVEFHRDHIIPMKRGGAHSANNVQALCKPCNLSKGDKMPWEWKLDRLMESDCERRAAGQEGSGLIIVFDSILEFMAVIPRATKLDYQVSTWGENDDGSVGAIFRHTNSGGVVATL